MLKFTKIPPPYGGVSRFTTQAMTWTGSFRTFIVHGPWTGSKTVRRTPNLAGNRIEYVLLTTWYGNCICFSAKRARPGSQKILLNGFTEWNFLRNKEKAYQNRESVWLCGGGYAGSRIKFAQSQGKQSSFYFSWEISDLRNLKSRDICLTYSFLNDDCFYYHVWRNNIVIAFGKLSHLFLPSFT